MKKRPTKIYGLIGESISKSLSPAIFEYLFKKHDIKAEYRLFPVKRLDLKSALEGIRVLGFKGVNVTAPFKEEAIKYLDHLDPKARETGAVNVIQNQNGRLKGFNTDLIGIHSTLKHKLGIGSALDRVILIGAGGAARACLAEIGKYNPQEILIFNRSIGRAKALTKTLAGNNHPRALRLGQLSRQITDNRCQLVVNAASGENPIIRKSLLKALEQKTKVFDLNYNLSYRADGNFAGQYSDGLYMLVSQAVESFKIWCQMEADPREVYRHIAKRRATLPC